jgi:hypothetical protein
MLWLYNKDNIIFEFFQVFINSNIVYSANNNIIYSLESTQSQVENNIKITNLDKITYDNYSFNIRIMDQLISYTNDINEQIVFTSKMNFIEPSNNKKNLSIFNFTYKKVSNNRMPNLIQTSYNFSSRLEFKIYKISDKVQFIIETNPNTKIIKKYFITTDLNLIKNYIYTIEDLHH